MTTDYKATPEQWRNIEEYRARRAFSDCSCLLELRARVEALEEAENDRRFEQCKAILDRPAPDPAGSLVEQVEARAGGDARAAIREVAAWLRENDAKCEMGGDAAATADLLEQEAGQ
jgi:predicted HAD superfamily phosphohydrolase